MIFKQITRKNFFFSVRFFSSILKDRYGFVAPSIPIPQSRTPNSSEVNGNRKRKKNKEPYRPPSSLDMTGKKIIHSNLPFDFRFSYTESNPNIKPIGLREPKYSPFGPGRVDRAWTGVCAPAVDPVLKSVEGDVSNDAEKKMEEWRKRRKMIIGELLNPAERAFLIEKCQKNRTKRQVNLGKTPERYSPKIISRTKCYRCHGYEHIASQCSSLYKVTIIQEVVDEEEEPDTELVHHVDDEEDFFYEENPR